MYGHTHTYSLVAIGLFSCYSKAETSLRFIRILERYPWHMYMRNVDDNPTFSL